MAFTTAIRLAVAADFDFFYRLYMHADTNPYLLYEWMSEADFRPIFVDLLKKNVIYVFETAGQSAGMFKFVPLQYRTAHIAYLGGVAIDPNYAGRGLGRAMLAQVIELGREKGLRRIELSAATSNDRAISLYEKMGFVREGVLRDYTYLASENRFLDEVLMAFLYEG